jgi:hypothetical protein
MMGGKLAGTRALFNRFFYGETQNGPETVFTRNLFAERKFGVIGRMKI